MGELGAFGKMAWAHTNVWAGGQLIATYDPNGLHFYLNDWTGSRRVQTDYEGVVEQTCTNLPYGDGETCSATPTEELYAGLERDSESGLDHAMYRQYASVFGRWTTPDPYDGSYVWSNPQSLNRYAYVNGRPMAMTDPSGQMPIPCPVGLPTSGFDPEFGPALIGYGCDDGIVAIGAGGWLASVAPYIGPIAELGLGIYDLGKTLGLWGQKPQFKGNVKASQSGKNVPNTPNSAPYNGQLPNGTVKPGFPPMSAGEKAWSYLACIGGMDPTYVGPTTTRDPAPTDPLNSTPGTSGQKGGAFIPDAMNQASSTIQCLINVYKLPSK